MGIFASKWAEKVDESVFNNVHEVGDDSYGEWMGMFVLKWAKKADERIVNDVC